MKSARTDLPPHIYEASSLAYRGLFLEGKDQSILVSGETGAGKTETVKLLLSHLATFKYTNVAGPLSSDEGNPFVASICQTPTIEVKSKTQSQRVATRTKSHRAWKSVSLSSIQTRETDGNSVDEVNSTVTMALQTLDEHEADCRSLSEENDSINIVVQKVVDSNPLLEAFGNAKTAANDNSSRFGKYIQMQFHLKYKGSASPVCDLAGSLCKTFLLEKGRVVRHQHETGDRTFHIFYQLLAAPVWFKKSVWIGLTDAEPSSFRYVGQPVTHMIEGVNDKDCWLEVTSAMELIGIQQEEVVTLLRMLCIVLQLGNIVFGRDPRNEEGSIISSSKELQNLANLTGLSEERLLSCFTSRSLRASSENLTVPVNETRAKDVCDALAKSIYQDAFDWLVKRINDATAAEMSETGQDEGGSLGVIGLLDIFGFENYKTNHFEQLCVNHANERLQQKFIDDTFKAVQREYQEEGLDLREIKVEDNSKALQLLEGKLGLVQLLNEECVRPKGNDETFVSKVFTHNQQPGSPLFSKRTFTKSQFGVRHYADSVVYEASDFVAQNTDSIPHDVLRCMANCTNDVIRMSCQGKGDLMREKQNILMGETLWTKFRTQLDNLMDDIGNTTKRYIRCIVPNKERLVLETDLRFTGRQLHYGGIMSAVVISRESFPNRMEAQMVINRFSILASEPPMATGTEDLSESAVMLLNKVLGGAKHLKSVSKPYICGKSRIYFRRGVLELLEAKRLVSFASMATKIQRNVRYRQSLSRAIFSDKITNESLKFFPSSSPNDGAREKMENFSTQCTPSSNIDSVFIPSGSSSLVNTESAITIKDKKMENGSVQEIHRDHQLSQMPEDGSFDQTGASAQISEKKQQRVEASCCVLL